MKIQLTFLLLVMTAISFPTSRTEAVTPLEELNPVSNSSLDGTNQSPAAQERIITQLEKLNSALSSKNKLLEAKLITLQQQLERQQQQARENAAQLKQKLQHSQTELVIARQENERIEATEIRLAAREFAEVKTAIRKWAKAWSMQDTDQYLTYYAPDFQPEEAINQATWKNLRRDRIALPEFIQISLQEVRAERVDKGTFRVTFEQIYQSNIHSDKVSKQIELKKRSCGWEIFREKVIK